MMLDMCTSTVSYTGSEGDSKSESTVVLSM